MLRYFISHSLIISLPLSDLVGKIRDIKGDLEFVAEYELRLTKRGLISLAEALAIFDLKGSLGTLLLSVRRWLILLTSILFLLSLPLLKSAVGI